MHGSLYDLVWALFELCRLRWNGYLLILLALNNEIRKIRREFRSSVSLWLNLPLNIRWISWIQLTLYFYMQSELNFVATFWVENFIFTLILLDIQWGNIKTVSSCFNFLFTFFFRDILKIPLRKLNGTLEGLICMELDFIRMKVIVNIYPQAHFFTSSVCWLSIFFVSLFTVAKCCCCWLLFPMADNFRDFPCVGNFERKTALSNLEISINIEFNEKTECDIDWKG